MTTNKTYFSAVVYSGSTCMCGALRHTSDECGHKHRSSDAAEKCLNSLQNWSDDHQTCSATWYNGKVAEFDTETDDEIISSYECDDNTCVEIRDIDSNICTC